MTSESRENTDGVKVEETQGPLQPGSATTPDELLGAESLHFPSPDVLLAPISRDAVPVGQTGRRPCQACAILQECGVDDPRCPCCSSRAGFDGTFAIAKVCPRGLQQVPATPPQCPLCYCLSAKGYAIIPRCWQCRHQDSRLLRCDRAQSSAESRPGDGTAQARQDVPGETSFMW